MFATNTRQLHHPETQSSGGHLALRFQHGGESHRPLPPTVRGTKNTVRAGKKMFIGNMLYIIGISKFLTGESLIENKIAVGGVVRS